MKMVNAVSSSPLRCALYARKSTEQDVHEDALSTTRQFDLGRRFAEEKGWTVVASFKDEAISGRHDETKRPGMRALLQAVAARQVDVIVMSDDSRLARYSWTAVKFLQPIHEAGVELWYYRAGRRVDLATALGRFMEFVHSFTSDAQREAVVDAVREAAAIRIRDGFVAGGRPAIGYTFRPVVQDKTSFKERVVRADEAAIVREIFARYIKGDSIKRIAETVPPVRDRHWAKSGVARVLRNPMHIGVIRTRTRDGQTVEHQRPALRIIDDRTWRAAARRLATDRSIYLRTPTGTLLSKPSNGIDSRYLLTGMMSCRCGSVLTVVTRGDGYRYYACHGHQRGTSARGWCPNRLMIPVEQAHATILGLVEERLRPDVIRDAITAVHRKLQAARNPAAVRARLQADLKTIDRELANLMAVIRRGTASATIDAEIRAAEARKTACVDRLTRIEQVDALTRLDAATIDATLTANLKAWVLRSRHVAVQRQLLRKLLPTRLVFEPHVQGRRKWYSFSGALDVAPLISGLIPAAGDRPADDRLRYETRRRAVTLW